MTARSAPRSLYGFFADTADRHPDAVALEVGDRELSYAELRDLAERASARLVEAAGGTPPRRVGLLVGRSVSAYVGYLAILRTGACVVPLNPGFPPGRNATIAATAGLDLTVAEDAEAGKEVGAPLFLLGEAELRELGGRGEGPGEGRDGRRGAPSGCDAADTVAPEDLAYLIFTSGSTGTPKGVPITHHNIGTYLDHVAPRYEIGPGSRLSQSFELTFDGSVHDLFVAWARGGTLVVPTHAQLLSPVKFVNAKRLTHWFSVPSLASFASRLGTLRPGSMPTLRWSVFGGEALPTPLAEQWQAAAPDATLEVLYGPTEATISFTGYRPPRDPARWTRPANGTMPIGTPYPMAETVVLDDDGRPAAVGELCVRGPLRFPGYLEPAGNAGRFLARDADGTVHPYDGTTPLTERHWYRTGDRVAEQDGVLVHLGRVDHQVKIRGHRIELDEVEGPLRRRPEVDEAVVVPLPGRDGQTELVAAVTGRHCDVEELYAAARADLPEYMMPRRISVLREMPHNANGKIDRRAVLTELAALEEQQSPTR